MEDAQGRRVCKPDPSEWGSFSEMLESLVAYTELHDKLADSLQPYGLTIHEILDGIEDVDMEAKLTPTNVTVEDGEVWTEFGPRARFWITKWAVSGFTAEQIAILLSRTWWQRTSTADAVEGFLSKRESKRVIDEQRVIRLHRAGKSPLEISRETGYLRQTVDVWLRSVGQTPNRNLKRVPDDVRQRVIAMRNRQPEPATYGEIRAACGVTDNQIRSVLRYANAQGLIRNYGREATA